MVFNGKHCYAEVLYFFIVQKSDIQHTLAAVKMFTLPDPCLLKELHGMFHVCRFLGDEGVVVVDIKNLTDIIGMVPFSQPLQEKGDSNEGKFFLVEKISLTSTQITEDNKT